MESVPKEYEHSLRVLESNVRKYIGQINIQDIDIVEKDQKYTQLTKKIKEKDEYIEIQENEIELLKQL